MKHELPTELITKVICISIKSYDTVMQYHKIIWWWQRPSWRLEPAYGDSRRIFRARNRQKWLAIACLCEATLGFLGGVLSTS